MHVRVSRVAALAAWLLSISITTAGSISIEWTPVPHPDLAGYRVHYGLASRDYAHSVDILDDVQAILDDLEDCTTHYVALKSIDLEGVESDSFSNEIVGWPQPAPATVSPAQVSAGGSVTIAVTGANLQAGAVLETDDPAITVGQVTVDDCWNLHALLTIDAAATTGTREMRVVNPDGVYGLFDLWVDGVTPEPGADLALHLDMDAASISGDVIVDRSEHGIEGTIVGAASSAGHLAQALEFDVGDDARIVMDHDPALDLGSQFTIAAWIRPASLGETGAGAIVDKLLPADAEGYALRLTGGGGLVFYGVNEQGPALSDTGIVEPDLWQHVAVVYDGGALTFYRDAVAAGTVAAIHDPRPANLKLLVGNGMGFSNDFDGRIDELRIYARALAPGEIADLVSAETGPCEDGDGDGYGTAASTGCPPGQPPDCDDADAAVHPGADEVCGDGVDQDCDGVDPACACADADGDGFDDADCGGDDCDDADAAVYPGAGETCDQKDNDCDGTVDGADVCVVPPDPPNLVAYWNMDGGSVVGDTLVDVSGNGNDGVISGATLEAGYVGQALRFVHGEDDFVRVPDTDALDLRTSLTIEAWIWAESFGQGFSGTVVDKFYSPDAEGYRLSLTGAGSYSGLVFYGATGQGLAYSAAGVIELRRWQHVAVTYDAPTLKFFVGGVEVNELTGFNDVRPTFRDLYIGNDQGRMRDFNGLIDEVRIWDRALTAEELAGGAEACDVALGLDGPSLEWGPPGAGFDVVRGDLQALCAGDGDFGAAVDECLLDGAGGTSLDYAPEPDPGEAFWFLVRRAMPACGYGTAPRDDTLTGAPGACQ